MKDLSFSIEKGEIVGVVGESGAGKSTIGNAVIDLLSPPGRIARGDIYLNGELISGKSQNEMRAIRGSRIGFIFQDPMTSLNPLFTVEHQLVETILANTDLSREAAFAKALELMKAVGIPSPELRIKQYPHQFSGGMRQRVVIAIALSGDPELIIADEPTTALDVSIQDQILQLIRTLCKERQVGCMLVTHDMGVVSNVTDKVAVMYRGDLVEFGTTEQVLGRPNHPYTRSLISAVPRSDVKLVRFPLVSYIEDAGAADTSIDLKTHWLGQSQDERAYEGALLRVENVDLKFVTKTPSSRAVASMYGPATTSASRSSKVRPSAWWGSQAPASPPSPAPSPASIRPIPARSSSRGSISPPSRVSMSVARCVARCRWCSRTLIRR